VPSIRSRFTQKQQNYNPNEQNTLMKIQNSITATFRAAALVSAFSLVAASISQAAFVGLPSPTPEVPGVLLGGLTATGGGSIVASQSQPFATAFNTGVFNTWVVDRDPGAGVLLDFYYQVVNQTAVPPPNTGAEVFRLKTTGGFTGLPLTVAQTDISPVTGLPVLGLKPARTADRDEGTLGSVGFEFPVAPGFIGDPLNIAPGQASDFLVVRTNSSTFTQVQAAISSGDTGIVSTFAAVPEPGSMVFALGVLGVCFLRNRKGQPSHTA
jgi:hypothetical protein